jgi:hypothetical protein
MLLLPATKTADVPANGALGMAPVKSGPIDQPGVLRPELPEFLALGPAGAAPLLEAAASDRANGQLEFEGPWSLTANLIVRHGKLIDATSGQLHGDPAAMRVFLWSEARYRWRAPGELGNVTLRVTVGLDGDALITEGLRQRAVWQRIVRDLPSLAARFEVDFSRPALVASALPAVAHTLCRLCDGHRSLGEVLRDSAVPDLEAASILGHLIGEGVLVRAKEPPRAAGISLPDDPPALGDAGDEQTARISTRRPTRPRYWPLVAIGLALGLGAAKLATRWHEPKPIAAANARINVRSESNSASAVLEQTNSVPRLDPPPPALAGPPVVAPVPSLPGCQRARSLGDPRRILGDCARAASAPDAPSDLLALLARLELERGAFAKAATRARRAIALDPNLAEAYAYLGFAEAEAGRRREAMAAYRRYLALAPRGSYAEDVRAIVHENGGR